MTGRTRQRRDLREGGPAAAPTLHDVARDAGVSIKTVSRVINDDPAVRPATQARVLQAIEALGYRPNPLARSLRTGRDEAIGLVVESIGDPFFAAMTEAVEEAVREAGLFLVIASAGSSADEERAVVLGLLHRSVGGLVIVPCLLDYAKARLPIGPGGVPVVFADRPAPGLGADSVTVDNLAGSRRATEHLISGGHRRIAFVGMGLDRFPLRDRLTGYRAALAAAGIPSDEDLVVSHAHDRLDPESSLGKVLSLADPATAVIAANAVASIDVVSELHRTGRTDVAFVSFDDFPIADSLTPPVTVVRQDPALMGRTATDLLLRRMRGLGGRPRRVRLPTLFLARGSGEIAPPAVSRRTTRRRSNGHDGDRGRADHGGAGR